MGNIIPDRNNGWKRFYHFEDKTSNVKEISLLGYILMQVNGMKILNPLLFTRNSDVPSWKKLRVYRRIGTIKKGFPVALIYDDIC